MVRLLLAPILPVPYDLCVSVPISRLLTVGLRQALVGAFSVIVKIDCETDGSFNSTIPWRTWRTRPPPP